MQSNSLYGKRKLKLHRGNLDGILHCTFFYVEQWICDQDNISEIKKSFEICGIGVPPFYNKIYWRKLDELKTNIIPTLDKLNLNNLLNDTINGIPINNQLTQSNDTSNVETCN